MRRGRWCCPALVALLLATGCAVTDPRPVQHTTTAAADGAPALVVAVERDADNSYIVRALARELAFGLAQRGRAAADLPTFLEAARYRGAAVPPSLVQHLTAGVADDEALAWLRAERVSALIFLDVAVYEQVWSAKGKRTRVGLTARGRQLGGAEGTWRAFTTPEVEDEPGQGFQIATEAALGALVRVIMGEPELPAALSGAGRGLPSLQLRW
ncbi:MAG: hypothetical protein HY728_06370 [Candidatus Rokubacteria bacterium]|nr:hypothetical protein [Candidatus Rokubacteria bacterium]